MPVPNVSVVAADLGASSGRVFLAKLGPDEFKFQQVKRFVNGGTLLLDTLYWDILSLYNGIIEGIRAAHHIAGELNSIAIDSWAVDYGLLDTQGTLIGNPIHYRDKRTERVFEESVAKVGSLELYLQSGIALQRFNTIYQLAASLGNDKFSIAKTLLLIPDLITYFLSGEIIAEQTNASTTQLLGLDGNWNKSLITDLGIDSGLFAPICIPPAIVGSLLPSVGRQIGLNRQKISIVAVGSHDTASAVVGVPTATENFAYISSGTWSLIGLELAKPIVSIPAQKANFTNERGVDGTFRFLKNIMGFWLLQQTVTQWERRGQNIKLDDLFKQASMVEGFKFLIDAQSNDFLEPGDMTERIKRQCLRFGQNSPSTAGEFVRCIFDSLALAYRISIRQAQLLANIDVGVIHIVGGGALNELLCQLTADACELPVIAGPVEAAAMGNSLMQARALGALGDDLYSLREKIRTQVSLQTYLPRPETKFFWKRAEDRINLL